MKIFKITLLFSSLILLASCEFYKDFRKDNEKPKLRYVDLQGNPRDVDVKTPPLNLEAMSKQGDVAGQKAVNQPLAQQNQEAMAQNKYAMSNNVAPNNMPDAAQNQALQDAVASPTVAQNSELGSSNQDEQEVEYDLSDDKNPESIEKTNAKKQVKPNKKYKIKKSKIANEDAATESSEATESIVAAQEIVKGFYVQAGSFTSLEQAQVHRAKIAKSMGKLVNNGPTQQAEVNGQTYYRILVGPFANKKQANLTLAKFKKKGHQAIIIKNK